VYVSRWAGAEDSAEFAAVYARSLAKRYKHATEVVENGKSPVSLESLSTLSHTHTWLTEEGPVVIAIEGKTVVVTEGLDQATTETLEKELLTTGAPTTK